MKKLWVLLFICVSYTAQSQVWFEAAAKGTYGFKGFLNSNIMNDGRVSYDLPTGYAYGGRFGVNFGYHNGISVEALLADNKQTFGVEGPLGIRQDYLINWKATDLYLLYRLYGDKTFLELGPKLSRLSALKQTITTGSLVDELTLEKGKDYVDYWSAALGFGTYVFGAANFSMMLGARFEYAFQDLVGEQGKNRKLPLPTLVPQYSNYKSSNPYSIQVCLEFNFGLGYFAKAACGRRGFFFKYD
ncbi:MAG TPA: hypothetical protein PKD14_07860 [Saprospiraceae bacterium]|nr:hypothetical protein [Saprospiraceae bacterium]HNJ16271.1 hypothetical protein [Saprospiraceae bacterium]HNJ62523.1 hypothetical protein [Saprospiraceae bacterium]